MAWQAYVLVSFFALAGLACIASIPFGVPGMWIMLGLAVLVELGDTLVLPAPQPVTFGWGLLGICGGLGVVAEIVEGGAGAAGTRYGGGTKRGMWGAILGGIVGAVLFTVVIPVPLLGSLVGALAGTFVGAFVGEATTPRGEERSVRGNLRAALGATVGRLAGTLGKTILATAIWALLVWHGFGL